MKNTKVNFIKIMIGIIFLLGIILISFESNNFLILLIFMVLFTLSVVYKRNIYLIISVFIFLLSFQAYALLRHLLHLHIEDIQVVVILDRLLLSIIVLCLVLTSLCFKKPIVIGLNKPNWNNRIYFPFVTRGFHSIKISTFLIIAILGNMLVFVPLIFFLNDSEQLRNLLLFGVAFSLINAFLEELIWRGSFFSILSNEVSILYALVFTSLAFGLHHIVIGIPFFAAFSFSIGGLFFALVVIKTNSIIPAVLWHFIINMCMVFSGLII